MPDGSAFVALLTGLHLLTLTAIGAVARMVWRVKGDLESHLSFHLGREAERANRRREGDR